MRRIEIIPRKVTKNGRELWMVRKPSDMGGGRKFFRTKKDAAAHASDLMTARETPAARLLALSERDQVKVMAAFDQAGGADDLRTAVEFWHQHRPKTEMTLGDTVEECLDAKESAGLRTRSLQALRCTLTQFRDSVGGDNPLADVTARTIGDWLKDGGWSAATRKTYLTDLRTLFSWARKQGYVVTDPSRAVEKPRLEERPPGILTVQQVKKLLEKARDTDPGLLGYLCPILFGGLRPAESQRLPPGTKLSSLQVAGEHAKGRRRRVVNPNATLTRWLKVDGVEFGGSNLVKRMRRLRKLCGTKEKAFPWPADCLRHSFCSYSMPIYGAMKTAQMAGHSEQVLFQHYREVVTERQARAFWALSP